MTLQRIALMGAAGYTPTHPETINWQSRVTSAGGTASVATLQAMETFCTAIDAESGLRAAITRLNLCCGDQLAAALVPLYLAESAGATAKGNATDTNVNFVAGDYTSGGLGKANNTNAYLNTGLTPNQVGTATSFHLSTSATNCRTTTGDIVFLGSYDNMSQPGNRDLIVLDEASLGLSGTNDRAFRHAETDSSIINGTSLQETESHLIGTRSSNTITLYRAGSSVATYTNANGYAATAQRAFYIFALNAADTPATFSSARMRMYSIGSGLTAAQVTAFSNAVAAFNTALGR